MHDQPLGLKQQIEFDLEENFMKICVKENRNVGKRKRKVIIQII